MTFFEARVQYKDALAANAAEFVGDRIGDTWGADQHLYPHANSPEMHTLKPILGEGVSLQSVVEMRRAAGKPTHVLELFGSADFLHDPTAADSLTGVRLTERMYNEPGRPYRERLPHHEIVLGDIYDAETLANVSENLNKRGIPSIDVMVCAPFQGWGTPRGRYPLNVHLETYYPRLEWAYGLLNPDGGTLLTEFPVMGLYPKQKSNWEERMNSAGIITQIVPGQRSDVVKIERQPTSPNSIVPLQGRCAYPSLGLRSI